MKRTMCFMIILIIALGTSLSACNLEASCSVDELYQPTSLNPTGDTPIDDLTPQLSWDYPEGCDPEYFVVDVAKGQRAGSLISIVYHLEVNGSERSTVVGPLVSGTHYIWTVTAVSDEEQGRAGYGYITIGPLCSETDRADYTPPILLTPAEGQVIRDYVLSPQPIAWYELTWLNTMACLPPEGFAIQIAFDPEFRDISRRGDLPSGVLPDIRSSQWNFQQCPLEEACHDCMRFYWRVLIGNTTVVGDYGDLDYTNVYAVSDIRSFIINLNNTLCIPDMGLILSPIPWRELPFPGELPPATPSGVPTATTREPANCRSGPALDYPILSILPAGGQFEIRGRNTDGDSWQVFDPEIDDTCWVNADLVEVIGIADLVEIVMPPPPPLIGPTDTPASIVDCSQYNGALWQSCNLDPACYWDPTGGTGNGECKNR